MGSLIHQLWLYMRTRKKFWLLPTLIMAAVVGAFVTVTKGTAVAPFIYAIFSDCVALCEYSDFSAFYHDSAAALVVDGDDRRPRPRKSASPARSTTPSFPRAGGSPIASRPAASSSTNVDQVVFYDKPLLKFERLLETYLAFAPQGFAARSARRLPIWLREKLFQERLLRDGAAAFCARLQGRRKAGVRRASPEPRRLAPSFPRPSTRPRS